MLSVSNIRTWLRSPAVLALLLVVLVNLLGWLAPIERHLLDMNASLSRHTVDSDVVLVEIDEQSLHKLHRWPWPRRYHAQLLDALRDVGVKDIFYDVDFSSMSTPVDDQSLARALAAYPRDMIMLPAFIQPGSSLDRSHLVASVPLPEFRTNTDLVSVNLHPDRDGLVRYVTGSWPLGKKKLLPAGLHMAGVNEYRNEIIRIDFSIKPNSIQRVSFADVLEGKFNPALFRGKHVIVGATAVELGDKLPVPVYRSLPGPVVQGLVYLTAREGGLRTMSPMESLSLAFALVLVLGVVFKHTGWRGALTAVVVLIVGLFAYSLYAYRHWHLIVATASPMMQTVFGYAFFLISRVEQQHVRLLLQGFDIRRKDALMSSVVNHSLDAILTVAGDGEIRSVNPSAQSLFARHEHDLVGSRIGEHVSGLGESEATGDVFSGIYDGVGGTSEAQAQRADGHCFPVELTLSRLDFDGDVLYTVFVRDITERLKQREALEHQATHDALTGLANRYLLNRELQRMVSANDAGPVEAVLLLLDLDRFKEINDSLGHGVGDQVLIMLADRFSQCVGDDVVLSRIGGDEFAILLCGAVDMDKARQVAETLLGVLGQPFVVNDMALEVGASVGIAHCPQHADDADTLMQHADTAMYVAKRAGSGIACYEEEFTRKSVLRMRITTGLRQAMAESELVMHYQPKVEFASGRVTGCEALLRWQHAELGFIPPDEIIDVAESTALIWPLTEWTLKRAMDETRVWHELDYEFRVAVNLSAQLLQDRTLTDKVRGWLKQCAAEPDWLTLEITETAMLSYPDRALANARALSAMGIHLSIDDFGTGYSSLSYLKRLPAHELKIDKSFVLDMLTEGNDLRIVKSTIELAHNLGLKVIAEGVESETVYHALARMGCDVAQGYYLSRPVPSEEFVTWLTRRDMLMVEKQSD